MSSTVQQAAWEISTLPVQIVVIGIQSDMYYCCGFAKQQTKVSEVWPLINRWAAR